MQRTRPGIEWSLAADLGVIQTQSRRAVTLMRARAIGVVLVVLGGCGPADRDDKLRVQTPFAEARLSQRLLYVVLDPDARIRDVVRVDLWPLRPGMPLETARGLLGDSVAVRHDWQGSYFSFQGLPSVELAHLRWQGSGGQPGWTWDIVWRREGRAPSDLFVPQLASLVVQAEPVSELVLHEQKAPSSLAVSARLVEGRVLSMRWYSIGEGPPKGQPKHTAG